MQNRRDFLKRASMISLATMLAPAMASLAKVNGANKRKVLVRSGWQTANIGDIGHTFGMLALLERHYPDVDVVLWPKSLNEGVEKLLHDAFPNVSIVNSAVDEVSEELRTAFNECALLIHSSGPYVVAYKELRIWWETTGKPFGIYGVSLDEVGAELQDFLGNASFIYCRDTESLKYLKTLDIKCPVQDFTPDSTFAINVYDDEKARLYLESAGLKSGEFICVIPRLRFTPYWQMVNREPSESEKERYAISMAFKGRDAEKMRNVMISWVRSTGLKVLVCPEMTYQVEFSKETLVDPLPEDVKKNVVWRDTYWLPDEATSVYKQARAMVCSEPHSLIMAVANGIPSIHVKQSTDTRKGQMWRDIGLGDWYFLMDETPASQITKTLLDIHYDYPPALRLVGKANDYVRHVHKKTLKKAMELVG